MTRKECLDAVAGCVLKDRQNQYGGPENNFERIATMWNGYLGTNSIKPWDVAAMMILLKMARARFNPKYEDNWVDAAGYAACGIECAAAQEEFDKALDRYQQEAFGRMFNKAGGNHPEIPDSSPEFRFGERVQFRDEIPSTSEPHWFDGVYVERLSDGGHAVKFGPHGHVIHCSDKEIRPAPKAKDCEESAYNPDNDVVGGVVTLAWPRGKLLEKRYASGRNEKCAEGCETLVEKDAPQTKEELMQRIVDCNPSIYKPRTPTGEELAEMAEEDAHG